MKQLLTMISIVMISSTALAQYTYDWKTGNSYTKAGNTVYGTNTNTGTTWTSTQTSTGSYGTDSKGNSWNYDRNTGNYYNSNGKSCFGKGNARVCN